MGRLYALKVNVLNRGGPADTRGCNIAYDGAVTTNGRKSAEAIVAVRETVKGRTVRIFSMGGKVTAYATDSMKTCSRFWCRRKETNERRKPVGATYGTL